MQNDIYKPNNIFSILNTSTTEELQRFLEDPTQNVNIQEPLKKKTPLILAIQNSNLEAVTTLLKHSRIDPQISDHDQKTALMYAIEAQNLNIIQILLQHQKIDPNAKDSRGKTALMYAIETQNLNIIQMLLEHPKIDPNIEDDHGKTALMCAAQSALHQNTQLLEILLERSSDQNFAMVNLNKQDRKYGKTTLHQIGQWYHAEPEKTQNIIDLLLKHGANINKTDFQEKTVLDYAVENSDSSFVDYLVAKPKIEISQKTVTLATGSIQKTLLQKQIKIANEKIEEEKRKVQQDKQHISENIQTASLDPAELNPQSPIITHNPLSSDEQKIPEDIANSKEPKADTSALNNSPPPPDKQHIPENIQTSSLDSKELKLESPIITHNLISSDEQKISEEMSNPSADLRAPLSPSLNYPSTFPGTVPVIEISKEYDALSNSGASNTTGPKKIEESRYTTLDPDEKEVLFFELLEKIFQKFVAYLSSIWTEILDAFSAESVEKTNRTPAPILLSLNEPKSTNALDAQGPQEESAPDLLKKQRM